jgi:hypothetical protein
MSEQAEWLGITFSVPMYITGEGEPYRPQAVMFFDAGARSVVGYELVHPVDGTAQAVALFRATTAAPLDGPPRTPKRLRVPSLELAEALRAELTDVEIVVAPTPELEGVIDALLEQLTDDADDEDDALQTLVPRGGLAEDVTALFEVAARLYELEPWKTVPPGSFVGVSCPMLGIAEGALYLVGQDEPPCGFSLFWTYDDVIAYAASIGAAERDEPIGAIPQHLIFNYEPRSEYPASMLEQVETFGFRVAGEDAYPKTMVIDSDGIGRPLTKPELNGLTVVLDAFTKLLADPALAGAWTTGKVIFAKSSAGKVTAEVAAPLAELASRVEELGPLHQRAEAFLEELAETMPEGGEPFTWAGILTNLSIRKVGALLPELTPEQLQELLFVAVPAEVMCEPGQAWDVIAGTKAALAHAGAHELEQTLPADAVKRLEERLGSPAAFGPEKSLFMAGTWAGYDMTTEEGITEFLSTQQLIGQAAMERAREAQQARKKR